MGSPGFSKDLLLELALKAREKILRLMASPEWNEVVRTKGSNVTRKIDLAVEKFVIDEISRRKLSVYLISEEIGSKVIGKKPPRFMVVLDPVDGTTNFARSIPFYSVSIAAGNFAEAMQIDDLSIGVVVDIARGDTFQAVKGQGAFFNDRKAKAPSAPQKVDKVISLYASSPAQLKPDFSSLAANVKIRTLGSAALELCYVGIARLDGFLDVRRALRLVDFAAANLFLQELGLPVTDARGRAFSGRVDRYLEGVSMAAANNREFHKVLLSIVNENSG